MSKFFNRFRKNESGATAIEYGLIAALVAVVLVGALTAVGNALDAKFTSIASTVGSAGGSGS